MKFMQKSRATKLTITCAVCGKVSIYMGSLTHCIGMARMHNWIYDKKMNEHFCDDLCYAYAQDVQLTA